MLLTSNSAFTARMMGFPGKMSQDADGLVSAKNSLAWNVLMAGARSCPPNEACLLPKSSAEKLPGTSLNNQHQRI